MLRLFLIILLVYLVIRMFSRMMNSTSDYSGRADSGATRNTRKEGSVTLEKTDKPGKIIPKDEGEYVDYEEIK